MSAILTSIEGILREYRDADSGAIGEIRDETGQSTKLFFHKEYAEEVFGLLRTEVVVHGEVVNQATEHSQGAMTVLTIRPAKPNNVPATKKPIEDFAGIWSDFLEDTDPVAVVREQREN